MILVTGGTGLVGSHLLLDLTQTEEYIRAIYREGSSFDAVKKIFALNLGKTEGEKLYKKIDWVKAPLDDIPALNKAFKGITSVYHSAALVSFNPADTAELRKTNIEGTANIANLCIAFKVEKLCYISSVATMGLTIGEEYVTENFTWHPENDHTEYAISKHGAEIEVWRASQEGVPVVILNPGVILGAGSWKKGSSLIFKKVDEGLNYHFPKVTGFVGVKDVAAAAIKAMDSPVKNEQFIVITENISFKKVLQFVAKHLNKPAPGKQLKPWMVYIGWILQSITTWFGGKKLIRKGDHKSLFENTYYSNKKIKEQLDFKFTPLEEVIKETAGYYRKWNSIDY
ncbi:NAD-dependent epimerase/dehydratase family protein [Antarcticibacterium flavum]|uniref:NAD-dependent epimerase/dehydratase family protein n=1 Tax=Antarcticibacterium flavum TaxID=2058175 RepID=A0A5B7X312_9FLAO|nr:MULTISPECIES: NAD-dependent epimerase/dehydratase family protein [Antarcticibacterium]MCM4159428.1 NAD-dependent epimerase [Antarcticibacterium sp. W02-3]QCY69934.1 NAD-dependent epimerase/dehydratase family protein [Antarcticibacterium flavum]